MKNNRNNREEKKNDLLSRGYSYIEALEIMDILLTLNGKFQNRVRRFTNFETTQKEYNG